MHPARAAAAGRGTAAGRMAGRRRLRSRLVGRNLGGRNDLHHIPIGIARPDTALLAQRMAGDARRARSLDTLRQQLEVLRINSEAQILEFLSTRRGKDRSPAVGMAVGVQIEALALAARIEAEFRIEPLRLVEIRYGENETIERMNRGYAVSTRRRLRRRLHR